METMTLDGIDGQHLWGFLTALGTLFMVNEHSHEMRLESPRLAFREDGTAVIHSQVAREHIGETLLEKLRNFQPYLEQDLAAVSRPSDFTRESFKNATSTDKVGMLDFLAGLACVVGDEATESNLCAANGASHQNLIQSMRDILNLVEEDHLRKALFGSWRKTYRVPNDIRQKLNLGSRKPTLRLDPSDERLYALRLSNPTTTDDFQTEIGAQALAIPAFALLPVLPCKRPITVSSTRYRQRATFYWALWKIPATLHTIRSHIWSGVGYPNTQRERGVFATFSCDRVSGSKGKLSFSPSQGIW